MKFNSSLTKAAMALNPADYIQLSNLGVSRDQAAEVDKRGIHVPSLIKLLQGGHNFHDLLSEHDKGTNLEDIAYTGPEAKETPSISAPEPTRQDLKELQSDALQKEATQRKEHVSTLKMFANLLEHHGKILEPKEVSFPEVLHENNPDSSYKVRIAPAFFTADAAFGPNGMDTQYENKGKVEFPKYTSNEDKFMRGWMSNNSNLTLDDLRRVIAHNQMMDESGEHSRKINFDDLWHSRRIRLNSEDIFGSSQEPREYSRQRQERAYERMETIPSDSDIMQRTARYDEDGKLIDMVEGIEELLPPKRNENDEIDQDHEQNVRQPLLRMINDLRDKPRRTLPFKFRPADRSAIMMGVREKFLSNPRYRPLANDEQEPIGRIGSKLSFKNPGRMIFNVKTAERDAYDDEELPEGAFGGESWSESPEEREISFSDFGTHEDGKEKFNIDNINFDPEDENAHESLNVFPVSFGEEPYDTNEEEEISESSEPENTGTRLAKVPCPFCEGKDEAIDPKPGSEYHENPCVCGNTGEVCPTCFNFKPFIPQETLAPHPNDTKETVMDKAKLQAAGGNNACPTCGHGLIPIEQVLKSARMNSASDILNKSEKVSHLKRIFTGSDIEEALSPTPPTNSVVDFNEDADLFDEEGPKKVTLHPDDDEEDIINYDQDEDEENDKHKPIDDETPSSESIYSSRPSAPNKSNSVHPASCPGGCNGTGIVTDPEKLKAINTDPMNIAERKRILSMPSGSEDKAKALKSFIDSTMLCKEKYNA